MIPRYTWRKQVDIGNSVFALRRPLRVIVWVDIAINRCLSRMIRVAVQSDLAMLAVTLLPSCERHTQSSFPFSLSRRVAPCDVVLVRT
jgi:hypothetical protein